MSSNEKFIDVAMQRDRLRNVLADLYDSLRHGVHNHMLPENCERAHSEDPEDKCKNGLKRMEVLWQMGSSCLGCDGIGKCHLSFEEKDVFEAMHKAIEAINMRPAEMPDVSPEDFEEYSPDKEYKKSSRWIARQLYRFCVGYWCYSDHDNYELEKKWEMAFNDTLCIALDSIGKPGYSFRKFIEIAERESVDKQDKDFIDGHPEIGNLVNEAIESRDSCVKGDGDVKTLVLHAVLIRMDYRFAHEYPGCDMGVYGGVFESIIDGCLEIAGLYPNDRPKSYDFDDKDEYEKRLLEFESLHKRKIYMFMSEHE